MSSADFTIASQQMRADWNARSQKDAHYYVAFGGHGQSERDFMDSASEVLPVILEELPRLPRGGTGRRALEIGCGPGRLMRPMSKYFDEIHGVDVSDEMIALARERLKETSAHVHATSGVDLGIFENNYFDFIYSCIVLQHIPDRDIVLNYLRESQRVLKPGGVLRCQLRGVAPPPSEMGVESGTWTGCFFSAEDILRFAHQESFPLVALSGVDTQYMWATFRNPVRSPGTSPGPVELLAVTSASGQGDSIPNRGREAAVSLWTAGMPESVSLADFRIMFGERAQPGCYISPVAESGACQVNAVLPKEMIPGRYDIRIDSDRLMTEGADSIEVVAALPLHPRLISVTDGITLSSVRRIETGTVRLLIEDVCDPAACVFSVAGRRVSDLQSEYVEPITATWAFSFRLHRDTPRGRHVLRAAIAGAELEPVAIEIV
ncbi:MAG TPA: class I SAM-dependent methyltransferase [Bryobacteraceae bacterium]|nr:class I SAM-dependent methyltransferase [Bryobacteraceae bacterium]